MSMSVYDSVYLICNNYALILTSINKLGLNSIKIVQVFLNTVERLRLRLRFVLISRQSQFVSISGLLFIS